MKVEIDTEKEDVDPAVLLREKRTKRLKRDANRKKYRTARDLVSIAYHRSRYLRKYDDYTPAWEELHKELNTPQKAFAWVSAFITVTNDKHQPVDIQQPADILRTMKCTDKSIAFLLANLLYDHGYKTHIFWMGYRADYLYPTCVVVENVYTLTLGATYKVHIGDQFDIMRDYYPDGTSWKVVSRDGARLIMSYIKDRNEYGSPDIIVYDENYWMKNQPLAYDIISKLRLSKKSTEGEVAA